MGQIDGNFSKQIWKSAVQFQNETVGMNNDLYEFLKWVSKQAGKKDTYRWANAVNNYAAGRYTVETFVKGRDVVVYVGDEVDNAFCRGSAHCSKDDRFDSNVGRAIALYRALSSLEDGKDDSGIYNPKRTDLEPPFDI